jgi:RNA polymerase sigma-70 factor (ECF subfamily)
MASSTVTPAPDLDRALLLRIAQGEEAALAELYDHLSPTLYTLACRMTGEPADAEEVVLDSFAQVWRDAARYEHARGSVAAWLVTICRSRALDLLRARGRRDRLSAAAAAAPEPEAPAADRRLERSERCNAVYGALAGLPAPQRQAIRLAYFEGLSQSEIAERTGEPLGTIKSRVRSAMDKLRVALRPYYFETEP